GTAGGGTARPARGCSGMRHQPGFTQRGGLVTRTRRNALIALLILVPLIGAWLSARPRNDREWSPDMAVLPSARFEGDLVHVSGIRNAEYRTPEDYTVSWHDRTWDLRELTSLWYLVEPFGDTQGPAHTLVSFGFSDGSYLAISAEIRREAGESFSPIRGMLRQYELMYVVADERDVIRLRTNYRQDQAYLYPMRPGPEQRRRMLVSMLERVNHLREHPAFYNPIPNTCTTNTGRPAN